LGPYSRGAKFLEEDDMNLKGPDIEERSHFPFLIIEACLVWIGIAVGAFYPCEIEVKEKPRRESAQCVLMPSRSLAQIRQISPNALGELVYCRDCHDFSFFISSGTDQNAWITLDGLACEEGGQ
jgi:hypothetical protein